VIGLTVFVLAAAAAGAQDTAVSPAARDAGGPIVVDGVSIDGPAPPVPPAVVTRDSQGRATIRAVRLTERLHIDGQLDEAVYRQVQPIAGFIQTEPNGGQPATEATEAWIFFDDDTLYVAARCYDSQPESRWVANEMRRDSMNVVRNENFAVYFDTFYDRRNAFLFEISPIGGVYDATVTNERAPGNTEWNPVWDRKAGRFDGGWTAEMAIPFRSLRYKPGHSQVWGVNMRRTVRWKNEESFVTRMPPNTGSVIFQISLGATLVGLDVPPGSRNVEVKPYGISSLTSDTRARPAVSNEGSGDAGFDVKYGVTQNLTADFTYNTDFAQVEVDEQQVNLTRFSLFFPEKREFFLEGQGIFDFGGAGSAGGNVPLLFFSRRIGLAGSRAVPIVAGGRLTGKVHRTTIGVLDVRSGEDAASASVGTNFSVLRVKQDVGRRSSVGALFTDRSVSLTGPGSSEAYGADAVIGLYDNWTINTYLARAGTPLVRGADLQVRPGRADDDTSYRGQVSYNGDRYGLGLERLAVGANFNPEVGFVRRRDFKTNAASFRFSPRPRNSRRVRRYSYSVSYNYLTDGDGRLESRDATANFTTEFQNSDRFSVRTTRSYEFLDQPFLIAPGVAIPVGGYGFEDVGAGWAFGNQRRLSGSVSMSAGRFYDGHLTSLVLGGGRFEVSPQVSLEPSVSLNHVTLPEGAFDTTLVSNRLTYTLTPFAFFSGLVQYNSSNRTLSTNLRFRWEYQSGSEMFLVYTDERDTALPGYPDLKNRAFVAKINRLFRF
jgi:hypothetical protein